MTDIHLGATGKLTNCSQINNVATQLLQNAESAVSITTCVLLVGKYHKTSHGARSAAISTIIRLRRTVLNAFLNNMASLQGTSETSDLDAAFTARRNQWRAASSMTLMKLRLGSRGILYAS